MREYCKIGVEALWGTSGPPWRRSGLVSYGTMLSHCLSYLLCILPVIIDSTGVERTDGGCRLVDIGPPCLLDEA